MPADFIMEAIKITVSDRGYIILEDPSDADRCVLITPFQCKAVAEEIMRLQPDAMKLLEQHQIAESSQQK